MVKKEDSKKQGIDYNLKLEILKLWIILLIILTSSVATFYFFFYTEICQDKNCFEENLFDCNRARWINDGPEATWLYTIKGISKGDCRVDVQMLMAKEGSFEIFRLEGLEMQCYTSLGIVTSPEQDLGKCSGKLKEGLQELMIEKMHTYILENLGNISSNLI